MEKKSTWRLFIPCTLSLIALLLASTALAHISLAQPAISLYLQSTPCRKQCIENRPRQGNLVGKQSNAILAASYERVSQIKDVIAAGNSVHLPIGRYELSVIDGHDPAIRYEVDHLRLADIETIEVNQTIPMTIRDAFGSITINKETKNSSSVQFGFSGALGSFSLANGESKIFPGIPAGSYSVEEDSKTGWHLEEVICSGGEAADIAGGVAINLEMGEDIQCTFVNGQLKVTADAGGPYSGDEGAALVLDAGESSRQEMIKEYQWDCNSDGTVDTTSNVPSGATCTYGDDGVFTLTLTAVDVFGRPNIDSALVSIENVAPVVDAGSNQKTEAKQTVHFAGSFIDPGIADTHTIVWDFGDGSSHWGSLTPHHSYESTGQYMVTLTVIDDDGGRGSATMTVNVVDGAPRMNNLEVSPQVIDEGQSFTLSGLVSDPEQDRLLSLFIDWGDGETQTMELSLGTICFSLRHRYADDPPGSAEGETYEINLKLTDDQGAFSTATVAIEVNNVAPDIDAGPDQRTVIGQTAAFKASVSDAGIMDTHTIIWDFGDGSPLASGAEAAHIFANPGTYTVTATVEDDDGGIGENSVSVWVSKFFTMYMPVISR